MAKNKIITSEGNVQFQLGDGSGKIINVHPFHIYSVFNEDTVSFILIAMPKSSGLAIFTSKAEDLEVNGTTYTFAELPDALAEAFAVAGAQARAEIVDELPETGQTNTIYLVPKEDGQGFDEYIYVDGQWELLGDTDIELDRYVEKTDFSAYTAATDAKINTISGDVATVSGQVASEVTRATGAEGALDTKIDTVSGDVITEASRAESAETTLDGKIDGKVLEVTQAEYDALVSGGTLDPLVLYIITDATPVNMNEYYKKTEVDAIESAQNSKINTISGDVATVSGQVASEVTRATGAEGALDAKIDAVSGNAITSGEVETMIDAAVSGKADADSVYTKSEVYTKAEVDEAIDDIDLSNYYTKSETSGATEIQNALDGKANSGDIKTFVAGRGISITTGETADTIAFNLPVYLSGSSAVSVGQPIGRTMYDNKVSGFSATAIGAGLNSLNSYETATGVHNIQRTNSNAFGNSGSTLFTIGNGAGDGSNYRHNALEVRQNGDIYIANTNDTSHSEFYKKPMIKLQDALGQGGGVDVVQTTGTSTTDVMSQDAVTTAINTVSGAIPTTYISRIKGDSFDGWTRFVRFSTPSNYNYWLLDNPKINGKQIHKFTGVESETNQFSLVETSAITSSVTSASTDSEIPSAKAVYDALGQGGGSSYTAGDGIDITNNVISVTGKADTSAVTAIQDSLSGYVTTDTEQIISGRKIFTYSASSSKAIEFKQTDDSSKVGFRVRTSAATNNELASFEFRPNTFTINGVQHPLLYFGHYRNNNTASGGIEQTVIGFRQYDQPHSAAYHYLLPLPERAKFPFSLTTSFKDYYAPMGFKVNTGGTIVTTDDTGVVDLSSYIGGGGSTYTAGDGIDITSDVISVTGKVDTDDFNTYSGSVESRLAEDEEVTAAALNTLNDALGGMKLVKLTQTEYDNLSTKDSNTLYVIVN